MGVLITVALVGGLGLYFVIHSSTARNAAVNAVWSSTDMASRVNDALYAHDEEIADRLGVTTEEVDDVISRIDVNSWEAVELPDGVTAVDSLTYDSDGTEVTVTVYDDPSYVTLSAADQEVTFAVPESAQGYLSSLPSLGIG